MPQEISLPGGKKMIFWYEKPMLFNDLYQPDLWVYGKT